VVNKYLEGALVWLPVSVSNEVEGTQRFHLCPRMLVAGQLLHQNVCSKHNELNWEWIDSLKWLGAKQQVFCCHEDWKSEFRCLCLICIRTCIQLRNKLLPLFMRLWDSEVKIDLNLSFLCLLTQQHFPASATLHCRYPALPIMFI